MSDMYRFFFPVAAIAFVLWLVPVAVSFSPDLSENDALINGIIREGFLFLWMGLAACAALSYFGGKLPPVEIEKYAMMPSIMIVLAAFGGIAALALLYLSINTDMQCWHGGFSVGGGSLLLVACAVVLRSMIRDDEPPAM